MISFDITKKEHSLILKIVIRAIQIANDKGIPAIDKATLHMDLTTCIANGNSLKLKELLRADDDNFFHDVYGIYNNIDRHTGKLRNFFYPRYLKEV